MTKVLLMSQIVRGVKDPLKMVKYVSLLVGDEIILISFTFSNYGVYMVLQLFLAFLFFKNKQQIANVLLGTTECSARFYIPSEDGQTCILGGLTTHLVLCFFRLGFRGTNVILATMQIAHEVIHRLQTEQPVVGGDHPAIFIFLFPCFP